jgi:hypothetical protein
MPQTYKVRAAPQRGLALLLRARFVQYVTFTTCLAALAALGRFTRQDCRTFYAREPAHEIALGTTKLVQTVETTAR